MKKIAKYIVLIFVVVMLIAVGGWLYMHYAKASTTLTTYLNYNSTELQPLQKLSTSKKFTREELEQVDQVTYNLIREDKLGDAYAARVFAYLYDAQRDFAALSLQLTGKNSGDINRISTQILCMFFTSQCQNDQLAALPVAKDAFSDSLAQVVFNHYQQRYKEDQANTHVYPEKVGPQYWAGERPYYAQEVGSWKLWRVPNLKDYTAPAPSMDEAFWQNQLRITEEARAHATPEQTKAVVFWAGGPGTLTPPGMWLQIANDYMDKQNVPLLKEILVRSVLAMGVTDACIVVFNSKYTYWIRRPFMRNPALITIMPTPDHPSYPAGHSTISGAADTILNYYFPANKANWDRLAYEAANSRVWGGIHYTIDSQEGLQLGDKTGQAALAGQ